MDGKSWSPGIPAGVFPKSEKTNYIEFPPTQARYFRFTILSLYDETQNLAIPEVSVYPSFPALKDPR
jgi:hypothetical protein